MASLWESLIPEELAHSRGRDRWASRRQRDQEFAKLQAFYKGGPALAEYLAQHVKEPEDRFADRKKRFVSLGFVKRLADEYANGIYGGDVEVQLPGWSDKQLALIERVWEYNAMDEFRPLIANGMVVNGGAYANVSYIQRDDNICYHSVLPQLIDYETDPDNPRRLAALSEKRLVLTEKGNEEETYWVWVAPHEEDPKGWGGYFSADGAEITDPPGLFIPNKYGRIPYVYWRGKPMAGLYEGVSYILDAMTVQEAYNNDLSDLRYTVYLQGYGIPWVAANKPPKPQGTEEAQGWGPDVVAYIGKDGSMGFASPNAPITEVLDYLDRLVDWMFQQGAVPVEIRTGTVTESGVALLIKWKPFRTVAHQARLRAAAAERDLIRCTCAIGRAHGWALPDPMDLHGDRAPVIRFLEDIVPADYGAQRTQDQLDVESGRMAPTDYTINWVDGVDSAEEAEEYLERIKEERSKYGMATEAPVVPGLGGFDLGLTQEDEVQQ